MTDEQSEVEALKRRIAELEQEKATAAKPLTTADRMNAFMRGQPLTDEATAENATPDDVPPPDMNALIRALLRHS